MLVAAGGAPHRSRRPISAWEPLIVHGGRELPLDKPQAVRDALAYGGRFRAFPGALVGMKPPQFAVWMFCQLGCVLAPSWWICTRVGRRRVAGGRGRRRCHAR